jgi:hypothetical protein
VADYNTSSDAYGKGCGEYDAQDCDKTPKDSLSYATDRVFAYAFLWVVRNHTTVRDWLLGQSFFVQMRNVQWKYLARLNYLDSFIVLHCGHVQPRQ